MRTAPARHCAAANSWWCPIAWRKPTRPRSRTYCCRRPPGERRKAQSPTRTGIFPGNAAFLPAAGEARPDWWIICRSRLSGWAFTMDFSYSSVRPRSSTSTFASARLGNGSSRAFDVGGLVGLGESAYARLDARSMARPGRGSPRHAAPVRRRPLLSPRRARAVDTDHPSRSEVRAGRRIPLVLEHRPRSGSVAYHDPHRPLAAPLLALSRALRRHASRGRAAISGSRRSARARRHPMGPHDRAPAHQRRDCAWGALRPHPLERLERFERSRGRIGLAERRPLERRAGVQGHAGPHRTLRGQLVRLRTRSRPAGARGSELLGLRGKRCIPPLRNRRPPGAGALAGLGTLAVTARTASRLDRLRRCPCRHVSRGGSMRWPARVLLVRRATARAAFPIVAGIAVRPDEFDGG